LGIFPLGCALASLAIGQDADWDLLNYHYYNPYALLHHRLLLDVLPALQQSTLNPLVDFPFYWLINDTPARVDAAIVGAVQGLNLVLVYLIARHVSRRRVVAIAASIAAGVAGGFASELGNAMGDSIVSIPVLAAVLCALVALERRRDSAPSAPDGRSTSPDRGMADQAGPRRWLWAAVGLLSGLGSGLKFTALPDSLGIVLACLVVSRGTERYDRLRAAAVAGVATLVALVATNLDWSLYLWHTLRDPFYFTDASRLLFHTPYLPANAPASLGDGVGLLGFLTLPIYWLVHPLSVAEIPLRELSIPIAYVLLVALAGVCIVSGARRLGHRGAHRVPRLRPPRHETDIDRYVIATFVTGLVVWAVVFRIYRYLIPLELLAPVVIFCTARRLLAHAPTTWRVPRADKLVNWSFVAIAALCAATAYPANYWLRVPFAHRFFVVPSVPMLDNHKVDAVVEYGAQPFTYVLPYLPPTVRTIGYVPYLLSPGVDGEISAVLAAVRRSGGIVALAFAGSYPHPLELPAGALAWVSEIGIRPPHVVTCEVDRTRVGTVEMDVTFCRLGAPST
jgi:hypothetical protein